MPTFKSERELRTYILKKSRRAVEVASEKAYRVIEDFVIQYYNDYSPKEYIRTYNLLTSLVKSDIRSTGNGWEAEVYFDVSALSYAKKVKTQTWSGMVSATGDPHKILNAALQGSHGGYVTTAPIEEQSLDYLNSHAIEELKKALIAAGIPIK